MAEVPIAVPASIRDEVVPSRKRVKLPPWLEIAKPRLIPLLLATTLGGMALRRAGRCPCPVWPAPWAVVLWRLPQLVFSIAFGKSSSMAKCSAPVAARCHRAGLAAVRHF